MFTLDKAIEKTKRTIDEYQSQRAYSDAMWVLQAAYDGGQQWGFLSSEAGRINIKRLPNVMDPDRTDVRITMNYIHRDVKFLNASFSPQRVACHCEARTGMVDDLIVRDAADKLLERLLTDIDGLRLLREMNYPRFVLGSMFIRRCMKQRQPTPTGVMGGDGREMMFTNPGYYWSLVFPWEVIRNVTATSFRPDRDEEIFIHEKPRTLEWVKRNMGVELKSETKLGDLIDQQSRIHAGGGIGYGATMANSKQPAVLIYESYYLDDDMDARWPWVSLCYRDPKSGGSSNIQPIGQGLHRNPFYGLPFHGFKFDDQIQAPWPRGVPMLEMQGQDMLNLAKTWLFRIMQAGSGKWLYEKSTVPEGMFNNRMDVAIPWTRKSGPDPGIEPKWIAGPQVNPAVIEMIRDAPRWMQDTLNLSEVQRGKTSARGESGEAVREKLSAANVDIEDLRRTDELTLSELLYGTLVDVTNPKSMRLDTARRLIGKDVPDEQVRTLLRNPVTEAITTVVIHPSTVRPTTPAEIQDKYAALATAMIIGPELAQWEMDEHGSSVNGLLANARRLQMTEIQAMITGQDVQVAMTDHHGYHREMIKRYMNSPMAMTLDPLARKRIVDHDNLHFQAQIAEAQGLGAMQPPPVAGRPSPPSAGGSAGMAGTATAPVGAGTMVA